MAETRMYYRCLRQVADQFKNTKGTDRLFRKSGAKVFNGMCEICTRRRRHKGNYATNWGRVLLGYEKKMNLARKLLIDCANYKGGENNLIIYDKTSEAIYKRIKSDALDAKLHIDALEDETAKNHGEEFRELIIQQVERYDIIVCITKYSKAHTSTRKKFSERGGRFLSIPMPSLEILTSDAMDTNFRELRKGCNDIADKLTRAKYMSIRSENGTQIEFNITGRNGNSCPGSVEKAGELGSPPDAEVNIAPIENATNGILIVDGSVANESIGLVRENIEIEIQNGLIVRISCRNKEVEKLLERKFEGEKRRIAGEVGFGMNPNCKLTGNMLTDEGTMGTFHIGFGSNFSIGGKNKVDFHLDCISCKPTLELDNVVVMEGGKFV